ncbi:type II toxin-antitoxin system death-on-curing family toxin [Halorussus ruber]|uniref:type II toxin-antitoxin system death-on-curing family toxin n=1 Tax=Halorussus ruber TaxID=1126238 RepID=UPI001092A409|nr:type II toxin-antitoxin system death-on-curing family toxin [Halorussus ruber]
MTGRDAENWYPSTEDVLAVHDGILTEYPDSERGVRTERQVQFALDFIEHGYFGEVPESVHEKAFHLLRLVVANHPFVDGNKRTALNTTSVFLAVNGYRFDYGDDVRAMLKLFGVREDLLAENATVEYLSELTAVESRRGFSDTPEDRLLEIAQNDRDAHREIYDALADE